MERHRKPRWRIRRTRPPQGSLVAARPQQTVAALTISISACQTCVSSPASSAGGRAELGAKQSRLDAALNNLQVHGEALAAASSQIQDTDFAEETARLTRLQTLESAGIASLAQARDRQQSMLELISSAPSIRDRPALSAVSPQLSYCSTASSGPQVPIRK